MHPRSSTAIVFTIWKKIEKSAFVLDIWWYWDPLWAKRSGSDEECGIHYATWKMKFLEAQSFFCWGVSQIHGKNGKDIFCVFLTKARNLINVVSPYINVSQHKKFLQTMTCQKIISLSSSVLFFCPQFLKLATSVFLHLKIHFLRFWLVTN